jgi:transcriptional regulator with XRE-family HTH domain
LTGVRASLNNGLSLSHDAPHPAPESIGARLRRLRLERGFSQRELSGPGVSYAYISRIEAGERRPSVKALRQLARKLGVSADYLETGSDLSATAQRELRLADAELALRLADEPSEAEAQLRAILAEATESGDRPSAIRAQTALGLAAFWQGRYDDAVAHLEAAVGPTTFHPGANGDVYASLARAYAATGATDRAVALLEDCLRQIDASAPDDALYVRFAGYLSAALTDAGELARSEAVTREAMQRARNITDPYTRVRVYWSLARVLEVEGRSNEALQYVRRAIALLEATDDTLHLARAHLLGAAIAVAEDSISDADEHVTIASRLLGPRPEPHDLALLRINESRVATASGDARRGEQLAREALALLGANHAGDQGEGYVALAEALAAGGDDEPAETAFRAAIELLESHNASRELDRAYEGLGAVLARTGRSAEAADVLAHAHGD